MPKKEITNASVYIVGFTCSFYFGYAQGTCENKMTVCHLNTGDLSGVGCNSTHTNTMLAMSIKNKSVWELTTRPASSPV